ENRTDRREYEYCRDDNGGQRGTPSLPARFGSRRRRLHDLDRRDEPIPDTSESLDVAWVFGGVAQRDAQTIGSCIEPVVEINEDVRGPQPALQLLASDDIAGTFDQSLQYLQRLSLQPQLDAMLPQLARAHVELE